MNKEKSYLFFIKIHEVEDDPSYQMLREMIMENSQGVYYFDGEPCYLYAVTSNKRWAKEFQLMRNMNNFVLKKERLKMYVPIDLQLQEAAYDYGDDAITFVTTHLEDESYNGTFEFIDDELEDVRDRIYNMDEIMPILKKPYQKYVINSGIINIIDFLTRIETGEPVYLSMDFMGYMFREFHFTFM